MQKPYLRIYAVKSHLKPLNLLICFIRSHQSNMASANKSNGTCPVTPQPLMTIDWAVAFSVVALFVFVSNVLILVAFTAKSMRKRSYYQVINLSVADLGVGVMVIPFYVVTMMKRGSEATCNIMTFIDPLFGLASFLILVVISCERFLAVCWPFRYRLLKRRHYATCLALPWAVAVLAAAVDGWPRPKWLPFPLFLPILSLGVVVMFACYTALWVTKNAAIPGFQPSVVGQQAMKLKNRQLAKTLFITTLASMATWLPFLIYVYYNLYGGPSYVNSYQIFFALKLLQFTNSFVNGIIYSLRMRAFRATIQGMVSQKARRPLRVNAPNEATTVWDTRL